MRILILSHVSDYIGGAEKSLLNIVDSWLEESSDLELHFILRKPLGGIEKQLEQRGIEYTAVDYTYWNDSNLPKTSERIFGNELRNTRAISKIEQVIDDFMPDVVLTNSIIAPWAAIAAHFKEVPHVWMVREYGLRDHGREFEIGEAETFSDIGILSELVLTNSQTLAKYIGKFIPSGKIQTVYTPFNIDALIESSRRQVDSPYRTQGSLKIGMTGNIAPGKGHDVAIEAVGILNQDGVDSEICIVGRRGQSDYMNKLEGIIRDYNIHDKVHFMGFQPNPLALIALADVAVMPSRMEAFGRVTFEYAAIGMPVCGSNSGATPEIVIDNETGFLYEPGNARDLSNKLKKYARNPAIITQHGKEAQKRAKKMMGGKWTAFNALESVRLAASSQKTLPPLNYSRRWLDYPQDAARYFDESSQASLTTIMQQRAKTRLRPYYHNFRSAISKIFRS